MSRLIQWYRQLEGRDSAYILHCSVVRKRLLIRAIMVIVLDRGLPGMPYHIVERIVMLV